MDYNFSVIKDKLIEGKIGVIPTDTIYGLVGTALNKQTVQRIYETKGRAPEKPLIILIGSTKDLGYFNINPNSESLKILNKYWPGKVSIILPCPNGKFEYLHRGTRTLAFRFPDFPELISLINQTGPLVAPSANPEGLTPAATIVDAKRYFGSKIDFYVNGGKRESEPSTLISIDNGKIKILREGAVKIIHTV